VRQNTIEAIIQSPASAPQAQMMFAAAHNLERFADRVSNICERTVFICTGEFMEIEGEDAEEDFPMDEDE
jgi:phosphate transport system protein